MCRFRLRSEQRFNNWPKEGILTTVWLTSTLLLLMSEDKTVQLIIHEVKNGNLEGLHQTSSCVNKMGVSMSLI